MTEDGYFQQTRKGAYMYLVRFKRFFFIKMYIEGTVDSEMFRKFSLIFANLLTCEFKVPAYIENT